ncbi:YceI family protein [Undibacterium sp. TJN19]|uniref:YceI family protein n=1 Tax=Undibacterium sp. TJN19 TaxID=3413055 RepID=UPI003BF265B7
MRLSIFIGNFVMAILIWVPSVSHAAWEIEPSHTHVAFSVGHLGLTRTPGIFRSVSGQVNFNESDISASSVKLIIASASVETANATRDAALRGSDWFDSDAYPDITFTSKAVKYVAFKHYTVSGDLTVRGGSVPVEFDLIMTDQITNSFLKVPAIGFSGVAHVSRSAFGMTKYLPAITDDVELTIQLEMNKKP